jgi:hypothetical protein
MKRFLLMLVLGTATAVVLNAKAQENEANALAKWAADSLGDHKVVLDKSGRLLPWTSFDNVIKWSMNYIERCPTVRTKFGDDPWYLVTSKLTDKGVLRIKRDKARNVAITAQSGGAVMLDKYHLSVPPC